MSFVDTICKICDQYSGGEYRLTVLGGEIVYAEGVRSVKSFSPTEVILVCKRCGVKVVGEGLSIEKFCGGDAVVKGRVKLIERICL